MRKQSENMLSVLAKHLVEQLVQQHLMLSFYLEQKLVLPIFVVILILLLYINQVPLP